MERGAYTWDAATKALAPTAAIDTNGDAGLSSLVAGATATVTGNTMVVFDGLAAHVLQRINSNANPLPVMGKP